MKMLYRELRKKSLVFFIVIIGFMFGPTIMAQQSNQDNGEKPSPVVYDLLIIAPKKYADALQPLIIHKNGVGIKTNLVTLNDVYHQMFWHGRDRQEKIKYFIKTAKEAWGITYVMLVGDFQTIPIRYVYNADNNTGWDEPCFISELYCRSHDKNLNFSTWDSSNNGIYGEWYGETAKDTNIDLP
jgi:hypothetical protein